MAEQETKSKTTEENMAELFQLLDEKAAAGELNEIDETDAQASQEFREEMEAAMTPMSASEQSAYEYSMMMNQYEAMLADYQRREAEEKKEAAAGKDQD